jgi:hypothetical protein
MGPAVMVQHQVASHSSGLGAFWTHPTGILPVGRFPRFWPRYSSSWRPPHVAVVINVADPEGDFLAVPEEEIWLQKKKSARTRRAYRRDVAHFLRTLGIATPGAQEGLTQKEIDRAFLDAAVDQIAIAPDFLLTAIGHFLALGHQTGTMPPFGLVRFLEAVGISSVQPGLISPVALLDTIEEGRAIGADALEYLLADGFDLAGQYFFVGSWFESGDAVDAVLMRNHQAPNKRAALIMEKVLEPRREWWTQAAAWAAFILYRAGNDERWQEFYALASAMAQGRAFKEIPLMNKVASQTVSAWEHRLDG